MSKDKKKETEQLEQTQQEEVEELKEVQEPEDIEEKLCKQLKEKDEQYLRLRAEYDNYRKRTAKEKEESFQNAKMAVISEFLEVLDNFERAKTAEGSPEDYQKGIEMIFTMFSDKLSSLGVESFGEEGEEFNPEIHQALTHIEDENLAQNVISSVFQKGYKIGDKIIRHAAVVVAN